MALLIEKGDASLIPRLDDIRATADRAVRQAIKPVVDLLKNRANLSSELPDYRRSAASDIASTGRREAIAWLQAAAAKEEVWWVRYTMEESANLLELRSGDPAAQLAAVKKLGELRSQNSVTMLQELIEAGNQAGATETQKTLASTAVASVSQIESWSTKANVIETIFRGISLSSILLIMSLGLAIVFGLMGVINMAHGELMMIGAYATWLVQEALQRFAPALIEYYLIIAAPVAFLVTATIGIALEAALLRHLYRRPLMSLLATWAVSLFLINFVRVTFGTQNLNFVTPFYVTGGVPVIGDFIFTWNRMFAIAFAAVTLGLTWSLIRLTPLGLNIRAVTQNRTMAGCIGIPVRRVDMLAFGLGSGLAGLAGLALAPIYSVNPQMGQNFVIDSFMVVVLGGVGTIVGTVVAALGIGQVNVLIEPLWGAVAAKVIVLLMIIAFLQWRPEGLFAVKGRRK